MILIHEIIQALSILYMDNYRNCIPSLQVQNITGIKWIWFYSNCCQLQVQLQQYKCYHQSYLKSGDHVYNMIGVPSLRDTFLKNHK